MVKIQKMLLHYGFMFTVPTAIAFYYWTPKTDEEIRRDVEARVKPDLERRRKNQAKYRELLQAKTEEMSPESKKQLDDLTKFIPRK